MKKLENKITIITSSITMRKIPKGGLNIDYEFMLLNPLHVKGGN